MTTEPTLDAGAQRPLAVVTGASSGIGRALAKQFTDHDFDVLVTAEDNAIHEAAQLLARSGCAVVAEQVDLATAAGVEQLYRRITTMGRPVAAAALNAGVGAGGRFVENDLADDLNVVALNVTSTVHLSKLLARDMVRRGTGRLLFSASVAATMPGPFYATYAASKAFVHSFAEALRYELKDSGVTVTSLMPGPTDTDFFEASDMVDTKVGQGPKDDPDDVARDGFDALMAGKDSVVAGSVKNKAQTVAANVLPDRAAAAIHAGMTKPQHSDDS